MKYLLPLLCVVLLAACGRSGDAGPGKVPVVNGTLSFPQVTGFDLHRENVDGRLTWYDDANRSWFFCRKLGEGESCGGDLKLCLQSGNIVTARKRLDRLGNRSGTGELVDTIDSSGRYRRIVSFETPAGSDRYLIFGVCDRADKTATITFYEAVVAKLTMTP